MKAIDPVRHKVATDNMVRYMQAQFDARGVSAHNYKAKIQVETRNASSRGDLYVLCRILWSVRIHKGDYDDNPFYESNFDIRSILAASSDIKDLDRRLTNKLLADVGVKKREPLDDAERQAIVQDHLRNVLTHIRQDLPRELTDKVDLFEIQIKDWASLPDQEWTNRYGEGKGDDDGARALEQARIRQIADERRRQRQRELDQMAADLDKALDAEIQESAAGFGEYA